MVLPSNFSGGPHNLGDPEDRSLRKVEKEILIPKKIRERSHKEKCVPQVEAFSKCAKETGLAMVFKCRKESKELTDCLTTWFQDENFVKECTEEYLNERSEYRRTGISKPTKKKETTSIY